MRPIYGAARGKTWPWKQSDRCVRFFSWWNLQYLMFNVMFDIEVCFGLALLQSHTCWTLFCLRYDLTVDRGFLPAHFISQEANATILESWNSWLTSCTWREWDVRCLLMRILFFKVRQPILDLMSGSSPSWCCVSVLFHLFPVKARYYSFELHQLLLPCSLCYENNKKKHSKMLTCSCEQPDPCAGSLAGSNSPSLQQCQPWSAADSDKEETTRE